MIKEVTIDKFKRLEYLKTLPEDKKVILEKKQIIEEIFKLNIPLAKSIIKLFTLYNCVDQDEIESYAYEGLMHAIRIYDVNASNSFSTLATKTIKNCIMNCFRNDTFISNRLSLVFFEVKNIVQHEYGKKYIAGDSEMLNRIIELLYQQYNVSEEDLKKIYDMELIRSSMINPSNNDIDNVYVYNPNHEIDILDSEHLTKYLDEHIFSKLTINETLFIKERYGLLDGVEHSLDEIATRYGKSYSMTKKILYNGLKKIRKLDLDELKRIYYSIKYEIVYGKYEPDAYYSDDFYYDGEVLVEEFNQEDYHL